MIVLARGDAIEAKKATIAMANLNKPSYVRLCRDKTAIFSTNESPFEIGKAYVLRSGTDVTLFGTGIMTVELLSAAKILDSNGINVEVVHIPTIKPLDEKTILSSIEKTGRAITAEEAQIAGGLGGAIAERFGESGTPRELMDLFGLTAEKIVPQVISFVENTPKYHPGF